MNYTYGSKPHAVTNAGLKSYTYDANGNMESGDGRTITWDAENRPASITKDQITTYFTYDGDGNRVKKDSWWCGNHRSLSPDPFSTGDNVTTSYYLGGKFIAVKKGAALSYIMQDNLGSTVGSVDSNGANPTSISYFSFGAMRSSTGTSPTDKKFTGQRLDSTGLYYYNARYYDPEIGRFISADTIVPNPANPQSLNRYSYCLNNPLNYVDPTGHWPEWLDPWVRWGQQQCNTTVNSLTSLYYDAQAIINSPIGLIIMCVMPAKAAQTIAITGPVAEQKIGVALANAEAKLPALANVFPRLENTAIAEKVATSKALVQWVNPAGRPLNDGALGNWTKETLSIGTKIDRFGPAFGRYAAPEGTPMEMRSLAPDSRGMPLNTYRVIKSLEVENSFTMPWYNQFGYGTQYRLPRTVEQLLHDGYLEVVK